jgi:hypothetical protein
VAAKAVKYQPWRACNVLRLWKMMTPNDRKEYRKAEQAIKESHGHIALVMHPSYYGLFMHSEQRQLMESLRKYTKTDFSQKSYDRYQARMKEFMNGTKLPIFLFAGKGAEMPQRYIPAYLNWFRPKGFCAVTTTPRDSSRPLLYHWRIPADIQWAAFRSILKGLQVKKISLAGELSYALKSGSYPTLHRGCVHNAIDELSGLFKVDVLKDLTFPNAVFTLTKEQLDKVCDSMSMEQAISSATSRG